jgi:hypothetical protein
VSRGAGFTDSTLVRLLARLNGSDVRDPSLATADRLSEWIGWTDAIALSGVLNAGARAARSGAPAASDHEVAECNRVRAALEQSVVGNNAFTNDVALYRQRYLARQQAMETTIGLLRARLRGQLAARSPTMAKLAAVDAVIEQALAPKAHRMLGAIPGLLEKHFKHLRKASQATEAPDHDTAGPTDAWLEVFRKDFHDALMAELDFRFQPVDGLLEALRSKQTTD